ncbi:MAG: flagellar motor switch phosphatase FliY [Lachnospiraceae bacterium]|nr:flagellar motor switch phosphatase FliY [Lachnospiraceae bacterium]
MDGMLSQDEINALLSGMQSANADVDEDVLTEAEIDAVGEVSNISMGTAATTLNSLLQQKVVITTPHVSYAMWEDLANKYDKPCVLLQISYKEGLEGNNVLVLKDHDVRVITNIMMGGPATSEVGDEPLSDLHLSAIGEAMNQMMGSAATSMSSLLNRKIDISPPIANLVDMQDDINEGVIPDFLKYKFVKVSFRMQIGDLIDSEMMQLFPFDFARELYTTFMANTEAAAKVVDTPAPPQPEPQPAPQPAPQPVPQPVPQPAPQMMQQPMQMLQQPLQEPVNVQPASFQAFASDLVPLGQKENIDLIMDVPLEVTVELGRTSRTIKEILEFAPGSIVELNKIAGEPVDVLVNGKYVAKGEVVVIEESFGVRISEIIR